MTTALSGTNRLRNTTVSNRNDQRDPPGRRPLGMSKSGLFTHFGSKDALQLATIDEARRIFDAEVL